MRASCLITRGRCKRPLLSNDYYPAFNRPNLELVTEPIARVTPNGILTRDGRERELDTLILATGFATTKFLSAIEVIGRNGVSIADAWSDGAQAYKGARDGRISQPLHALTA